MGWGKKDLPPKDSRAEKKRQREVWKEKNQRQAAQNAEARKKAAKTVTGNPSHYTSGDGRRGGTTRRDTHHGED